MLVDLVQLAAKMGLVVVFHGFLMNTFSILLYAMKKHSRTNLTMLCIFSFCVLM
jgi:hypothetical protein